MDDLQIVTLCIKGNSSAWTEFIKIYGSLAQRILGRYFRLEPHDVENVFQHVLIKLHDRGLANFRGKSKFEFRAYFKTIVLNEAKTYLHSESRFKNNIDDLYFHFGGVEDETVQSENLIENMKDPGAQPDQLSEYKEAFKLIDKMIEGYSLKDRQIFLFKIKGYKENEICELMGIPMGSVASSYSRMVEKITGELKKNGIEL